MIELSAQGRRLFDLLMQIPPDFDGIRYFLRTESCSPDDVNRAALRFAEECGYEESYPGDDGADQESGIGDYAWEEARLIPNQHSAFLREIIGLLLDFGLDAGFEADETNLLDELPHIVNEYVGADTLALLFEHGADPMLTIRDGESVFSKLDFCVAFDAIEQYDRRRYDALLHSWLVFLGYGARREDGSLPLELFVPRGSDFSFDITDFRQHRNYIFGLSHVRWQGESWALHIFDKRTMWEVARY